MRRWSLIWSLAGALALSGCGAHVNTLVKSPPPRLFIWSSAAAAASATPQQAFAAGMRLDLCNPVAARSVTMTWLAASPTYGVAWVVADCRNNAADPRPVQALFLVHKDPVDGAACNHWTANNAGYIVKPPAGPLPTQVQAQTPAWLSLPDVAYQEMPTGTAAHPISSVQSWLSATHVYITGRFEGHATRPATAISATVAGHPGWLVVEHGMASVVVPLASGWTFFFSGMATASETQTLAAETLGHLDEALPVNDVAPAATPDPNLC